MSSQTTDDRRPTTGPATPPGLAGAGRPVAGTAAYGQVPQGAPDQTRGPAPAWAAQPVPRGVPQFLAETAVLYERALKKLFRRPVMLYFSMIQPAIWLLLFGQIFNRITRFPGAAEAFGGTSYFQFFAPAVILQTILFGSTQSGIGIIADMDSGFLDKLLTTPIHRMAILLGRILGDLTRMVVQGLIIVVITWGFGRFQADPVAYPYGPAGVAGALGVALLFGLGLAGLNVFIALRTRNTESTFLIANVLTFPLLFTSSAQLPRQLLPEWLQRAAALNPVTYAVEAMRILLNGPQAVHDADPGSVLLATVVVLGGLAALTLLLAVRSFRKSVR
jgi:ABC-2 type transport system permease protein